MVSVSTYILNIRSDGECKVIYYCTTERGVRGRTGVFDGLTLIGSDPRIAPLQFSAAMALSAITNSTKPMRVE